MSNISMSLVTHMHESYETYDLSPAFCSHVPVTPFWSDRFPMYNAAGTSLLQARLSANSSRAYVYASYQRTGTGSRGTRPQHYSYNAGGPWLVDVCGILQNSTFWFSCGLFLIGREMYVVVCCGSIWRRLVRANEWAAAHIWESCVIFERIV
jgi:hypothetical protein